MTESIAVLTGATGTLIDATLLATAINWDAIYATEIIGRPATNAATSVAMNAICEVTGATYAPTVATSGTTAEIFETASGKEFDRSDLRRAG
jgi:hypothetical protein